MATPRTDKIYCHIKADASLIWFRFDIDDAGVYQFLFQTGTSAPDQALVLALPEFNNAITGYTVTSTTGSVIDPAIVPAGTVVPWVTAPATAASAGTVNQIAYDASYLYVCISANTWVRTPLATWV